MSVREERRGAAGGRQPFSCVFLDPVPPGGGDCSRQPGQQRDGHRSLGQCFFRAREWIPWACGSRHLDAGVMNLVSCVIPAQEPRDNAIFLVGGRLEGVWKMDRAGA